MEKGFLQLPKLFKKRADRNGTNSMQAHELKVTENDIEQKKAEALFDRYLELLKRLENKGVQIEELIRYIKNGGYITEDLDVYEFFKGYSKFKLNTPVLEMCLSNASTYKAAMEDLHCQFTGEMEQLNSDDPAADFLEKTQGKPFNLAIAFDSDSINENSKELKTICGVARHWFQQYKVKQVVLRNEELKNNSIILDSFIGLLVYRLKKS